MIVFTRLFLFHNMAVRRSSTFLQLVRMPIGIFCPFNTIQVPPLLQDTAITIPKVATLLLSTSVLKLHQALDAMAPHLQAQWWTLLEVVNCSTKCLMLLETQQKFYFRLSLVQLQVIFHFQPFIVFHFLNLNYHQSQDGRSLKE